MLFEWLKGYDLSSITTNKIKWKKLTIVQGGLSMMEQLYLQPYTYILTFMAGNTSNETFFQKPAVGFQQISGCSIIDEPQLSNV